MISHLHRVIYIHIPKTAGTSIEQALGHTEGYNGRDVQDHRTLRQLQWPHGGLAQMSSAANLREGARAMVHYARPRGNPNNRLSVSRRQFEEYFKFAVVRDPWSRAFSWYQNVRRDPIHRRQLRVSEDMTFEAFLEEFAGRGMLRSQLDWVVDFSGAVGVDMICRFDRLGADFDIACQRAGLGSVALPHKLRGDSREAATKMSSRAREIIAATYGKEIRAFGLSE